MIGVREQFQPHDRARFLALPGQQDHVDHARIFAQHSDGGAEFLACHIVDIAGQLDQAVVPDTAPRGVEQANPQDIGQPRQHPHARARAGCAQPSRWAAAVVAAGDMRKDRRTGWRHPLAGDAIVVPVVPFKDQRRRRRGNRQLAVRRVHQPAAQRQRREAEACPLQRGTDAARRRHVHQRVPIGDFVEMHTVDGNGVHARFGFRDAVLDRAGGGGGALGQIGGLQQRAQRAVGGVLSVPCRIAAFGQHQVEPARGDAGGHMIRQARVADVGRQHCRDIRHDAVREFRQRVQHGGDEHIARRTAHRVKMDVQPPPRHQ